MASCTRSRSARSSAGRTPARNTGSAPAWPSDRYPPGEMLMQRTKPPFRADHVGSLLRSAPLKEARAKRQRGEATAAELKAVEDREIETIIKKQEDVGLQGVTDG